MVRQFVIESSIGLSRAGGHLRLAVEGQVAGRILEHDLALAGQEERDTRHDAILDCLAEDWARFGRTNRANRPWASVRAIASLSRSDPTRPISTPPIGRPEPRSRTAPRRRTPWTGLTSTAIVLPAS